MKCAPLGEYPAWKVANWTKARDSAGVLREPGRPHSGYYLPAMTEVQ